MNNLNQVFTTDLIFGLIPGLTLIGIHKQQQTVRLIAQSKHVSYLVIDGLTNEPVLFDDGEHFIRFIRFLGLDQITVLLPKKNVF